MTDPNGPSDKPVPPFGYDWIANLLTVLDRGLPAETNTDLLKSCAAAHYRDANMAEIVANYQDDLEGFLQFLCGTWGWRITCDPEARTITADEAKNACVCPIVQYSTQPVSGLLCHCSEGFAERMFSSVLGRPVRAQVVRSILRGGESCVYLIDWSS